jgi:hypothetical protein
MVVGFHMWLVVQSREGGGLQQFSLSHLLSSNHNQTKRKGRATWLDD